MIVKVRDWLQGMWPQKGAAVTREYASLAQMQHFLADVALRGAVFSACHVPGDPYTSAVNEGRRQLALEIIKLAHTEPVRLFALIEKSPSPAERANARQSIV